MGTALVGVIGEVCSSLVLEASSFVFSFPLPRQRAFATHTERSCSLQSLSFQGNPCHPMITVNGFFISSPAVLPSGQVIVAAFATLAPSA